MGAIRRLRRTVKRIMATLSLTWEKNKKKQGEDGDLVFDMGDDDAKEKRKREKAPADEKKKKKEGEDGDSVFDMGDDEAKEKRKREKAPADEKKKKKQGEDGDF